MGHTQFIPTSYQAFAVDFTGDGRRDIWSEDPTDALATTANYLARHGWQRGQPWAVEVRLPEGALTCLQHIILSHHGEPDFGAAKIPATPEALLVSMLDNLDAKTIITLDAARPDVAATFNLGGNFTERQWALKNVKLYKPDPLEG